MVTPAVGEVDPPLSTRGKRVVVRWKIALVCVLFIETAAYFGLLAWWLVLLGFGSAVMGSGILLTALAVATMGGVAIRSLLRRRFRFDLRTMFALVSLASLVSWWLASYVARYVQERRQNRAIGLVAKHHRAATYRQLVDGDDPLLPLKIDFSGSKLTDRELLDLAGHPNLTGLNLRGSRVTDRGMSFLSQFQNLTSIDVSETPVTATGIEQLRHVPTLCTLSLDASQLRQLATAPVDALPQVSQLWLDDARIDDQAISDLDRWHKLTSVVLLRGGVTDSGLAKLGRLTALHHLHVDDCAGVTDAGLVHLRNLRHLQLLIIRDTNATAASGRKLQELLPNCRIIVGQRGSEFYEGGPPPTFLETGNGE